MSWPALLLVLASCGLVERTDAVTAYSLDGDAIASLEPGSGHMTSFAGRVVGVYDDTLGIYKLTPHITLPIGTSWRRYSGEFNNCEWLPDSEFRCVDPYLGRQVCSGYVEPRGRWDAERRAIAHAACHPDLFFDLQRANDGFIALVEERQPYTQDRWRVATLEGTPTSMYTVGPFGDLWQGGTQCGAPKGWDACGGEHLARIPADVSLTFPFCIDEVCVEDAVPLGKRWVLPVNCGTAALFTRSDPQVFSEVGLGIYLEGAVDAIRAHGPCRSPEVYALLARAVAVAQAGPVTSKKWADAGFADQASLLDGGATATIEGSDPGALTLTFAPSSQPSRIEVETLLGNEKPATNWRGDPEVYTLAWGKAEVAYEEQLARTITLHPDSQ